MQIEGKNAYLSGPMTGVEHNNVAAFAEAHAILHEMGAAYVHNPAHMWLELDQAREEAMTHEGWMRDSVSEIARRALMGGGTYYDLLVSLPGWEDSEGAYLERCVAAACGIECVELAAVLQERT